MSIESRIPTEVLGEIFLHTIDEPISNIQGNHFPWALNRVCKSWRFAFVTYPCLWTWITIDLAESHSRGQDMDAVNQCLSLCLERSRNYPLNISLYLPTKNEPSFIFVWQTFLSCSRRWQIVYLDNIPELQFISLDSCTGATPILESLVIRHPLDLSDFTGFQIAPQLTRFGLLDPAATFAVQNWTVPWMQLTTLVLRLEEIVVDQLCVLFKQLRDIEILCLILDGNEPSVDLMDLINNSRTPQCLPHLRVLRACCVNILGLITAPSLSELYLEDFHFHLPEDDSDYRDMAEDILRSFIQRSSCKIHKLTLSDISKYLFTPLVELFPDVVELCLTDHDDGLMCLEHLLSPDHLPGLRVLDCTAHRIDVKYLMAILFKILKLRNSPARFSAVRLAKIIFRPAIEGGEASVPVTTTDWVSFKSYVHLGICCELNLTRDVWFMAPFAAKKGTRPVDLPEQPGFY